MHRWPPARSGVRPMAVSVVALFAGLIGAAALAGQAIPDGTRAEIDAVFADVDRPDGPGCALGIVEVGDLLYERGYGMANLDWGIPIDPGTNFYLGSVSKQFTAAAIALAARQGYLSLDDDIREYVPDVPDYGPTITVRHLVHHTSGLRDYLELGALSGRNLVDVWSVDGILELIARQEGANFAPGERYMYSNTGYFLLSEIVRRATGKRLREYAQESMFGPLEMTSTRFHDDYRDVLPARAVGYTRDGDRWVMNHAWGFDQVGSGGVYSNIDDLARWDADYYREGMGGPGFTAQMLEQGVLNDGEVSSYAFGLDVASYRGLATVSHGGALAGFRTELLRFPVEERTVLVLCNFPTSEPGRRAREVADVLLADRFPEPARTNAVSAGDPAAPSSRGNPDAEPEGAAGPLSDYAGSFYSRELEATCELGADGEALEVRLANGDAATARSVGGDVFRVGGLTLSFAREGGAVTGFILDSGRAQGVRFERRP